MSKAEFIAVADRFQVVPRLRRLDLLRAILSTIGCGLVLVHNSWLRHGADGRTFTIAGSCAAVFVAAWAMWSWRSRAVRIDPALPLRPRINLAADAHQRRAEVNFYWALVGHLLFMGGSLAGLPWSGSSTLILGAALIPSLALVLAVLLAPVTAASLARMANTS